MKQFRQVSQCVWENDGFVIVGADHGHELICKCEGYLDTFPTLEDAIQGSLDILARDSQF